MQLINRRTKPTRCKGKEQMKRKGYSNIRPSAELQTMKSNLFSAGVCIMNPEATSFLSSNAQLFIFF